MFKLAAKKTITWPVTVHIPQDGGKTTAATFHAEFEVLDQDELNELVLEGKDMVSEVLVGWKGVADEQGGEIAYSAEEKKKLIAITYVRNAILTAYGEVQQGRAAARKN